MIGKKTSALVKRALKKTECAKFYEFNPNDADLFKDVVFIVEASMNEMHTLWADWHGMPRPTHSYIEKWQQEGVGSMFAIGTLDGRPVNICIYWAVLNGKRIMFYDMVSQVVDYDMVDKWFDHWSKHITYDNGYRWAQTNASNFHTCAQVVGAVHPEK